MNIGFDYWNVCSHFPNFFKNMTQMNMIHGNKVYIVSAIGKNRIGTVQGEVDKLQIPYHEVIELVFTHPNESPKLKTEFCLANDISAFYDDREDVCAEMVKSGILAFRVPRFSFSSDISAERD